MAETVEGKTYLPNDFGDWSGGIEGESARICERLAAHALSQEDRRPRLVTGDDSIELSAGMVDVLRRVAEAMRQGMAVSVVPRHTVLSTQQATDMLLLTCWGFRVRHWCACSRRGRFPSSGGVATVDSICPMSSNTGNGGGV